MALMMKAVLMVSLIFVLVPKSNSRTLSSTSFRGFRCPSCDRTRCANKWCPGGKVMDACNCCLVCEKKETEVCGGYRNIFGTCGRGLTCSQSGHWLLGGICIDVRCPHNQIYMTCGSGCQKKCGDVGMRPCSKICKNGCSCPPTLPYMTSDGECVREADCPADIPEPTPYEGYFVHRTLPMHNWHYVTITDLGRNKYLWSNKANVSWTLTDEGTPEQLTVDEDSTAYYDLGHKFVRYMDNREYIIGPLGKRFNREKGKW